MEFSKDLIAASSTPLVLAILAEGDSYGYAIIKRVQELSGGEMEWTDGMLYPVLHRLERLGFIRARWEEAESGRRRKYYRITPQGKARLAEERRQWQTVDATLRGVWKSIETSERRRIRWAELVEWGKKHWVIYEPLPSFAFCRRNIILEKASLVVGC